MNWYLAAWKKYADFSGRARRSEIWYFMLFHFLIFSILILPIPIMKSKLSLIPFVICWAYVIVSFIPSMAVLVRRLHDTSRSGLYYFISFIPIIGMIMLIIFLKEDGVPGPNKYGPNPKAPHKDPVLI